MYAVAFSPPLVAPKNRRFVVVLTIACTLYVAWLYRVYLPQPTTILLPVVSGFAIGTYPVIRFLNRL